MHQIKWILILYSIYNQTEINITKALVNLNINISKLMSPKLRNSSYTILPRVLRCTLMLVMLLSKYSLTQYCSLFIIYTFQPIHINSSLKKRNIFVLTTDWICIRKIDLTYLWDLLTVFLLWRYVTLAVYNHAFCLICPHLPFSTECSQVLVCLSCKTLCYNYYMYSTAHVKLDILIRDIHDQYYL